MKRNMLVHNGENVEKMNVHLGSACGKVCCREKFIEF